MKFPVDLLADVSQSELERSAQNYMNNLLYSNPDSPEHLTLSDSSQVSINISSVGFVPLYGYGDKQKILALFSPSDPLTAVAMFLLDRWWTMNELLKTADTGRDGAVEVKTVGERIVLYVLNRVIYRAHEMSSEELPFLCHGEKDYAKIIWSEGEAVGFYTVKPTGSLYNSFSTRSYQLPVMDSIFVRKSQRGKGFGLQMLGDFVLSFKEDMLGLRYPLTMAMYKVCQKFLLQYPEDADLLWEVEGTGAPTQRTKIASKIQTMDLSTVSKSLTFTEESIVITEVTEKDVVMEVITTQINETESMECTVEIVEEVTVLRAAKVSEAETPVVAQGRSSGSKQRKMAEKISEERTERVIRIEDIEAETPEEDQLSMQQRTEVQNVSDPVQMEGVLSVTPEEKPEDVVDIAPAEGGEASVSSEKPARQDIKDMTTEKPQVDDRSNGARDSQVIVENVASEIEDVEEESHTDTVGPVVSEVFEVHNEAETNLKVSDEKSEQTIIQHEAVITTVESSEAPKTGRADAKAVKTLQSETPRRRSQRHKNQEEETLSMDKARVLRKRTILSSPTPKSTRPSQKLRRDVKAGVEEVSAPEMVEELVVTEGDEPEEITSMKEDVVEETHQLKDDHPKNQEKTEAGEEPRVEDAETETSMTPDEQEVSDDEEEEPPVVQKRASQGRRKVMATPKRQSKRLQKQDEEHTEEAVGPAVADEADQEDQEDQEVDEKAADKDEAEENAEERQTVEQDAALPHAEEAAEDDLPSADEHTETGAEAGSVKVPDSTSATYVKAIPNEFPADVAVEPQEKDTDSEILMPQEVTVALADMKTDSHQEKEDGGEKMEEQAASEPEQLKPKENEEESKDVSEEGQVTEEQTEAKSKTPEEGEVETKADEVTVAVEEESPVETSATHEEHEERVVEEKQGLEDETEDADTTHGTDEVTTEEDEAQSVDGEEEPIVTETRPKRGRKPGTKSTPRRKSTRRQPKKAEEEKQEEASQHDEEPEVQVRVLRGGRKSVPATQTSTPIRTRKQHQEEEEEIEESTAVEDTQAEKEEKQSEEESLTEPEIGVEKTVVSLADEKQAGDPETVGQSADEDVTMDVVAEDAVITDGKMEKELSVQMEAVPEEETVKMTEVEETTAELTSTSDDLVEEEETDTLLSEAATDKDSSTANKEEATAEEDEQQRMVEVPQLPELQVVLVDLKKSHHEAFEETAAMEEEVSVEVEQGEETNEKEPTKENDVHDPPAEQDQTEQEKVVEDKEGLEEKTEDTASTEEREEATAEVTTEEDEAQSADEEEEPPVIETRAKRGRKLGIKSTPRRKSRRQQKKAEEEKEEASEKDEEEPEVQVRVLRGGRKSVAAAEKSTPRRTRKQHQEEEDEQEESKAVEGKETETDEEQAEEESQEEPETEVEQTAVSLAEDGGVQEDASEEEQGNSTETVRQCADEDMTMDIVAEDAVTTDGKMEEELSVHMESVPEEETVKITEEEEATAEVTSTSDDLVQKEETDTLFSGAATDKDLSTANIHEATAEEDEAQSADEEEVPTAIETTANRGRRPGIKSTPRRKSTRGQQKKAEDKKKEGSENEEEPEVQVRVLRGGRKSVPAAQKSTPQRTCKEHREEEEETEKESTAVEEKEAENEEEQAEEESLAEPEIGVEKTVVSLAVDGGVEEDAPEEEKAADPETVGQSAGEDVTMDVVAEDAVTTYSKMEEELSVHMEAVPEEETFRITKQEETTAELTSTPDDLVQEETDTLISGAGTDKDSSTANKEEATAEEDEQRSMVEVPQLPELQEVSVVLVDLKKSNHEAFEETAAMEEEVSVGKTYTEGEEEQRKETTESAAITEDTVHGSAVEQDQTEQEKVVEEKQGLEEETEDADTTHGTDEATTEEDEAQSADEEETPTVIETRAKRGRKPGIKSTPRRKSTRRQQKKAEEEKQEEASENDEEPEVQVRVLRGGRKSVPAAQKSTARRTRQQHQEEEEEKDEESTAVEDKEPENEEKQSEEQTLKEPESGAEKSAVSLEEDSHVQEDAPEEEQAADAEIVGQSADEDVTMVVVAEDAVIADEMEKELSVHMEAVPEEETVKMTEEEETTAELTSHPDDLVEEEETDTLLSEAATDKDSSTANKEEATAEEDEQQRMVEVPQLPELQEVSVVLVDLKKSHHEAFEETAAMEEEVSVEVEQGEETNEKEPTKENDVHDPPAEQDQTKQEKVVEDKEGLEEKTEDTASTEEREEATAKAQSADDEEEEAQSADEEEEPRVIETRAKRGRKPGIKSRPRHKSTRKQQKKAEEEKQEEASENDEEPEVKIRVLRGGRKSVPTAQTSTPRRTWKQHQEEEEEKDEESTAVKGKEAEKDEEQAEEESLAEPEIGVEKTVVSLAVDGGVEEDAPEEEKAGDPETVGQCADEDVTMDVVAEDAVITDGKMEKELSVHMEAVPEEETVKITEVEETTAELTSTSDDLVEEEETDTLLSEAATDKDSSTANKEEATAEEDEQQRMVEVPQLPELQEVSVVLVDLKKSHHEAFEETAAMEEEVSVEVEQGEETNEKEPTKENDVHDPPAEQDQTEQEKVVGDKEGLEEKTEDAASTEEREEATAEVTTEEDEAQSADEEEEPPVIETRAKRGRKLGIKSTPRRKSRRQQKKAEEEKEEASEKDEEEPEVQVRVLRGGRKSVAAAEKSTPRRTRKQHQEEEDEQEESKAVEGKETETDEEQAEEESQEEPETEVEQTAVSLAEDGGVQEDAPEEEQANSTETVRQCAEAAKTMDDMSGEAAMKQDSVDKEQSILTGQIAEAEVAEALELEQETTLTRADKEAKEEVEVPVIETRVLRSGPKKVRVLPRSQASQGQDVEQEAGEEVITEENEPGVETRVRTRSKRAKTQEDTEEEEEDESSPDDKLQIQETKADETENNTNEIMRGDQAAALEDDKQEALGEMEKEKEKTAPKESAIEQETVEEEQSVVSKGPGDSPVKESARGPDELEIPVVETRILRSGVTVVQTSFRSKTPKTQQAEEKEEGGTSVEKSPATDDSATERRILRKGRSAPAIPRPKSKRARTKSGETGEEETADSTDEEGKGVKSRIKTAQDKETEEDEQPTRRSARKRQKVDYTESGDEDEQVKSDANTDSETEDEIKSGEDRDNKTAKNQGKHIMNNIGTGKKEGDFSLVLDPDEESEREDEQDLSEDVPEPIMIRDTVIGKRRLRGRLVPAVTITPKRRSARVQKDEKSDEDQSPWSIQRSPRKRKSEEVKVTRKSRRLSRV